MPEPFVFVSYSSADRQRAEEVTHVLEGRGITCWIAPRDVRPGREYAEQLQGAIENCRAFIVLISPDANESMFVRAETEMAFSLGKQIYPVRIADVAPRSGLALFLKLKHWVDLYGTGAEKALDRLVRELSGEADDASASSRRHSRHPPVQDHNADAASDEFVKLAVKANVPYYLEAWSSMDRRKSRLSWNWAAFLSVLVFTATWPAYRKMWGLAATLFLIDFSIMFFGPLLYGPKAEIAIGMPLAFVFAAIFGAFGNWIYRWHVMSLVGSAQYSEAPRKKLARRGGVSWLGLGLLIAGYALLYALQDVMYGHRVEQLFEGIQADGSIDADGKN